MKFGHGFCDFVLLAGISKERDFKIPVPVRIGSSGVGQSCSVAEKCVSGGWSVYFKPLGK